MSENIVDQFIFSFSRAEYALKASRFLKDSEDAKADWDDFINNIKDSFDENRTEDLKSAVNYLREKPPKKQVVNDGQLDWKQTNNASMSIPLFLNIMVRRVRNNLFHGGKIQTGFTEDLSRDIRLIESAKVVLLEMIYLNEEVKHYYKQPII